MIENIYIIHYKVLTERRKYLEAEFSGKSAPKFIDQYDRNTVSPVLIREKYSANPNIWRDRCRGLYRNPPAFRSLSGAEICNHLSHVEVLKEVVAKNQPYAMVLEDDVILHDGFFDLFESYWQETPKDFDMVFFGSSFTIRELENAVVENQHPIQITEGVRVYEKIDHPKTRTVDAYLLSNSAAQKLLEVIKDMSMPYDFDLAYFIKLLDLKVYWWEPGIIHQGSMSGQYASAIRKGGVSGVVRRMLTKIKNVIARKYSTGKTRSFK